MFVVLEDAKRSKEWQRIYAEIERGNDNPGFGNVFDGFRAAVDAPAETVWQEIYRANPNIKVRRYVLLQLLTGHNMLSNTMPSGYSDESTRSRMEEEHG